MKTLTLSLPDALMDQLRLGSESHGFRNPSEYIADVLQRHQANEQRSLEELLEEGLSSGAPLTTDLKFWAEVGSETDALLDEHEKIATRTSAA